MNQGMNLIRDATRAFDAESTRYQRILRTCIGRRVRCTDAGSWRGKVSREVNEEAVKRSLPTIDILNQHEETRIRELISVGTWPNKWTGEEPSADEPFDELDASGALQRSLFTALS
jgi:hypothetical protein